MEKALLTAGAGIWAWYLARSKRVKNTYAREPFVDEAE